MLTISVPLAFVAMATMPLVYWTGVRMRKSMFPVSWIIQSRLADVATIVDENVNGVRVVKSFAAEEQQLRSLAGAADKLQWGYIKDADLRARFTPMVQNLPQVGLALVLLFGGYMVIHGGLRRRRHRGLQPLPAHAPGAVHDARDAHHDGPAGRRLGRADLRDPRRGADRSPTAPTPSTWSTAPGTSGSATWTSPTTRTPSSWCWPTSTSTSLPGQTVAIVGRTGAGKSTVARLLTRFYDVKHGSVEIDGHDVRDLTLASLRANVGVVLDEPFLFCVSVRDNIAYGKPSATLDEVEAAAKAAGAHEFISHLAEGYDTVVGERGYTLSGGQRQRIAIARTLLVNPPVMVLDDATSAIDVQVEQTIHAGLKVQMEGRTTLIIAHRLSTISLADRVVLLDQHKVVADGTHAELLATTPLYAEVLAQAAEFEAEDERAELERRRRTVPGGTPLGAMLDAVRGGPDDVGRRNGMADSVARRAASVGRRRPDSPSPASPPSCRPASTASWRRSPSTRRPTSSSSRTPTRTS